MFKVGDRVKHKRYGKGTINKVYSYTDDYQVKFDKYNPMLHDGCGAGKVGYYWNCHKEDLKLVEGNMKKEDLKQNDIVTLRNGDRLVLIEGDFYDLSNKNHNSLSDIDDLDDYLKYDGYCYSTEKEDNDIVKVERPVEYETVFEREEVQELTVDEISERLGYKVKVVGEDK